MSGSMFAGEPLIAMYYLNLTVYLTIMAFPVSHPATLMILSRTLVTFTLILAICLLARLVRSKRLSRDRFIVVLGLDLLMWAIALCLLVAARKGG
jgi:hypothetical protein